MRMKRIVIFVLVQLFAFTLGTLAQSAKVIALTPDEARQAKFMQDQVDIAIKRQKDFYESLQHKYTQTMTLECRWDFLNVNGAITTPPCDKTPVYHNKDRWSDGFQYSEDYKYIVPVEPKPLSYETCGIYCGVYPRIAY